METTAATDIIDIQRSKREQLRICPGLVSASHYFLLKGIKKWYKRPQLLESCVTHYILLTLILFHRHSTKLHEHNVTLIAK